MCSKFKVLKVTYFETCIKCFVAKKTFYYCFVAEMCVSNVASVLTMFDEKK